MDLTSVEGPLAQYDFLNNNSKMPISISAELLLERVLNCHTVSSQRPSDTKDELDPTLSFDFCCARIRSTHGDEKPILKDAFPAVPPKLLKHEKIVPITLIQIQEISFLEIKKLITAEKPYPSLRLKENHIALADKFLNLHTHWLVEKKGKDGKLFYKKKYFEYSSFECFFIVIKDILTALCLKGIVFSREASLSSIICTLFHWTNLLLDIDPKGANWMKIVKYKLAAFAAYWKCNSDLPKPPFHVNDSAKLLINGIIGKTINSTFGYIRTCIVKGYNVWKSQNCEHKTFYYSVFDTVCRGIKKGCPRATEDLLADDIRSTVNKFCTPSPAPTINIISNCNRWCDCNNRSCIFEQVLTPEDLEIEVERTITEICGDNKFCPSKHFNLNIPSISSATDCPRSLMGGLRKFIEFSLPSHNCLIIGNTVNITLREPLLVRDVSNDVQRRTPDNIVIVDEPAFKPLEELSELNTLGVSFSIDGSIEISSKEFFEIIIGLGSIEDPLMKAVALAEALKIRGITTPPAFGTFLGKPLQKFIAKLLLKFKCFSVTGGPISSKILKDTFPFLLEGEKFLSGDYDDATNKLRTRFTRVAIRKYCSILGVDQRLADIYERNLCDGMMYDPDLKDYRKQENAQPMGNILSFVLLCTINAAATRKAWEIDHRRVTDLKSYPALINGDDFLSTFYNFNVWEKVLRIVGLENSLGKTYFVKDFVEINSLSFVVDYDDFCYNRRLEPIKDFYCVNFINFGLAKMIKRSDGCLSDNEATGQKERILKIASLGDCHTQLTMYTPELYNELTDLFIYFNKDLLKDPLLSSIQWFIPKWLGGLGLNPGPKPEERLSDIDIKLCGEIFSNFSNYNPLPLSTDTNFDLHNCIMKELKSQGIASVISPVNYRYAMHNGILYDLEEENRILYNYFKYLWFRETIEEYHECMLDKRHTSDLTSHLSGLKSEIDGKSINILDESLKYYYSDYFKPRVDDALHCPPFKLNTVMKKKEIKRFDKEIDLSKRMRRILFHNGSIMRKARYNLENDYKERTYDVRKFLTCPQPTYLPIFISM
jgi:hypothetical protein